MKKTQLPNIYGENVILPPPLKGVKEEKIPKHTKPPKEVTEEELDLPFIEKILQRQKEKRKEMGLDQDLRDAARKQEIENIQELLQKHEKELSQERQTMPPPSTVITPSQPPSFDSEVFKPTLTMSSRLYSYFEKYSAPPSNTVMLPPPLEKEKEEEEDIDEDTKDLYEKSLPRSKVSPYLNQFVLEEGEDSLDPNVLPFFGGKAPDKEKEKKLLEDIVFQGEDSPSTSISGEDSTVPPPKKASKDNDYLLRLCSQYHDLCCKL